MTVDEVMPKITAAMANAIMQDESAIEKLPFRDRDELIMLGVVKRANPNITSDGTWRTWMTALGVELRERL